MTVEFTPAQRKLHDDVLATQALILTTLHPTTNVAFLMTMIRRQAASCLYGLAPLLRDILTRHLNDLNGIEGNAPDFDPAMPIETAIAAQIAEVLRQAEALDPTDPKLEAVRRVVREKVQLPNRRVMLFSTFRHTLTYLLDKLNRDAVRVGLIHGDISDEDRRETRRRFELAGDNPDALDVLLILEVGMEGLDYQFCDCIVNYDLPWNPMRIEQRIGRIDRRGQASEKIRIVNIITPGTVDADIYNRCLLRIGIFERELGASDEILGGLTRELQNIAEDFRLTEKERAEKLQQLADNNVRLIREQQELEERQAEFFALRIPLRQAADDLRDASSRWLSADLLTNLVQRYLAAIGGGEQEWLLGEKPVKTLRLNQEMRNRLLQDYAKLPRSTALTSREWEAWLKGSLPHLRVTFGQQAAADAPDAALLSRCIRWFGKRPTILPRPAGWSPAARFARILFPPGIMRLQSTSGVSRPPGRPHLAADCPGCPSARAVRRADVECREACASAGRGPNSNRPGRLGGGPLCDVGRCTDSSPRDDREERGIPDGEPRVQPQGPAGPAPGSARESDGGAHPPDASRPN